MQLSLEQAHATTFLLSAVERSATTGLPDGHYELQVNPGLHRVEAGDVVQVTGPNGDRYDFSVTRARRSSRQSIYISGVDLTNGGRLSVSVSPKNGLTGKVHFGRDRLLIKVVDDSTIMISVSEAGLNEVVPEAAQDDLVAPPVFQELTPPVAVQTDSLEALPGTPSVSRSAADSSAVSTISLLVLYEPGIPSVFNEIDYLINYTNEIFSNSQVSLRLELVAAEVFSLATTNDRVALDAITDNPTVDALRQASGADMATYLRPFVASADGCGIAWVIGANGGSFNARAIERLSLNVVNVGSDGNFFCSDETMAHELGHNFGAAHNREDSRNTRPFYPYAYGAGASGSFGTVMSFLGSGVPYFSNPSIMACSGFACGEEDFTDVARAINNVHPLYAAVYESAAPDAPTITALTPTSSGISVAFSGNGDGGSPITGYTASCGEFSRSGPDSPIVITGLAPNTSYSCTVAASNGVGESPSSLPVEITTLSSEPDPPVITRTDVGDEEISLFVFVASDGGSFITGYDAVCTDLADATALFTSSSTVPLLIVSGLVNGSAYSCTVSATNAIGASAMSSSIGPIIPELASPNLPLWLLIEASESP